jgi:hypothetical protein
MAPPVKIKALPSPPLPGEDTAAEHAFGVQCPGFSELALFDIKP